MKDSGFKRHKKGRTWCGAGCAPTEGVYLVYLWFLAATKCTVAPLAGLRKADNLRVQAGGVSVGKVKGA